MQESLCSAAPVPSQKPTGALHPAPWIRRTLLAALLSHGGAGSAQESPRLQTPVAAAQGDVLQRLSSADEAELVALLADNRFHVRDSAAQELHARALTYLERTGNLPPWILRTGFPPDSTLRETGLKSGAVTLASTLDDEQINRLDAIALSVIAAEEAGPLRPSRCELPEGPLTLRTVLSSLEASLQRTIQPAWGGSLLDQPVTAQRSGTAWEIIRSIRLENGHVCIPEVSEGERIQLVDAVPRLHVTTSQGGAYAAFDRVINRFELFLEPKALLRSCKVKAVLLQQEGSAPVPLKVPDHVHGSTDAIIPLPELQPGERAQLTVRVEYIFSWFQRYDLPVDRPLDFSVGKLRLHSSGIVDDPHIEQYSTFSLESALDDASTLGMLTMKCVAMKGDRKLFASLSQGRETIGKKRWVVGPGRPDTLALCVARDVDLQNHTEYASFTFDIAP